MALTAAVRRTASSAHHLRQPFQPLRWLFSPSPHPYLPPPPSFGPAAANEPSSRLPATLATHHPTGSGCCLRHRDEPRNEEEPQERVQLQQDQQGQVWRGGRMMNPTSSSTTTAARSRTVSPTTMVAFLLFLPHNHRPFPLHQLPLFRLLPFIWMTCWTPGCSGLRNPAPRCSTPSFSSTSSVSVVIRMNASVANPQRRPCL